MRIRLALLLLASVCGAVGISQRGIAAAQASEVDRSATIEDLAAKLEQRYVFPEVGRKYAAMLRANATAGKYSGIADDKAFAQMVTDDLERVAFDGHLKLVPTRKSAAAGGGRRVIPDTIESAARVSPEIAYIRLGKFFGEPDQVAAVKKFISDNADAKTLILDVRTHIGGGLDEMNAMFPYLFDKETVLVGMDTRQGIESPLGESPTLRPAAAPPSVIRRNHVVIPAAEISPLAKARVFVLASGRTGSAGEHFVLSLKRTGRATVIGETTYGAGNFGRSEEIAGGFQAFIAVGRTFDPDTNKGWDYVGIAPHVTVPAAEALTEALVRSGLERGEAEKLSAKHGPPADAVSSQRKAPATIAGI